MQRQSKRFVRKSKAERQREIVAVTVRLLGTYGVQGTTVSRIAAAAGISRGALYQHFPNREALLEAAFDAMGERSSSWITQSSGADVPERLLSIVDKHSAWSPSEYSTFVRPFFQLIASNREAALTQWIVGRQQEDLRYLVDLVEEGKREGTIADDVESEDVAWSLLLHAWGEDIARLMGVDRYVTDGTSSRILRRLLATYLAPAAPAGGAPPAAPTSATD